MILDGPGGPNTHKVLVHEEGRKKTIREMAACDRLCLTHASFESGGMQGLKKLKSQGNEFFLTPPKEIKAMTA